MQCAKKPSHATGPLKPLIYTRERGVRVTINKSYVTNN